MCNFGHVCTAWFQPDTVPMLNFHTNKWNHPLQIYHEIVRFGFDKCFGWQCNLGLGHEIGISWSKVCDLWPCLYGSEISSTRCFTLVAVVLLELAPKRFSTQTQHKGAAGATGVQFNLDRSSLGVCVVYTFCCCKYLCHPVMITVATKVRVFSYIRTFHKVILLSTFKQKCY